MTNVSRLRDKPQEEANGLLDSAKGRGFEEVLIVGVDSTGGIVTLSTGTFSRTRTLGLLEQLKFDILHSAA